MTDKELLELAAKAAGHVVDFEISTDDWLYIDPDENGDQMPWNPLTDDGDALRLAVKLNIHHYLVWDGEKDEYSTAVAHRYPQVRHIEEYCGLNDGQDTYTATRRAIVRAAASIGGAN